MSWIGGVGDFAKGFGEGVWDGAKGMAQGVGHLAKGTWDIATDDDARRRAWETAVADAKAAGGFVETAVTDPGKAAGQVGDAVASTWGDLSTAYHQAAAEGHAAEFIGKAFGRTAFEVGTAVVPAGLATKGLEGAGLLGRAGEAGELLGGAVRGAEAAEGGRVASAGATGAAARARAGEGADLTAAASRADKTVDASAEADVAERATASSGVTPEVTSTAPTEAGTIRDANPTRGKQNCVNCVVATDSILRGTPASALPGGPFQISRLEQYFGGKFKPATLKDIEATLQNGGNGSAGIVFAYRPGQPVGHVFNAVNQGGTIRFLDGQIGRAANTSYWSHFQFMPTKRIGK